MGYDGLEVFDTDDDVHIFLHIKVFEVFRMDRDGSLERLFKYFY